jgi:hypothetical protein
VNQAPAGRLRRSPPQVRAALLLEMEQLDAQSVLVADRPGADAVVRVVHGRAGARPGRGHRRASAPGTTSTRGARRAALRGRARPSEAR